MKGRFNNEEEWLKSPSDRLTLPVTILTVGLVLAFSMVFFLLFLRVWFGSFGLSEFLTGGARPATIKVALLDSGYTAEEIRKLKGDYATLIKQWETMLEAIRDKKVSFEKISDARLEKGLAGFEVLLLPSAMALSEKELEAIRAFVKEGGGLLISWASGTRASDGAWRGWEFIKELAGVEVMAAATSEAGPSLLTMLRSDSVLALGMEPGQWLTIIPRSQPLLTAASSYDAYWARPVVTAGEGAPKLVGIKPVFLQPEGRYAAVIVHRSLARGRVVWMGFGLDMLSEKPEDTKAFQQFLLNSLTWLSQRPVAVLKAWPGERPAAAIFSLDVEQDSANALKAQKIFKERALQGSFFLVSELAKRYPDIVAGLASAGEVAIHGDTHNSFADEPYELQLKRLSAAKKELAGLSGQPVIGFRPPKLGMDNNTIKAAVALDMKYIGTSQDWARLPRVIEYPERMPGKPIIGSPKKIVLFPQPYNDDYRLFHLRRLSAEVALKEWKEELEQTVVQGGLFFFSSHTTSPWGLLSDRSQVLAELLDMAKERKVWVATASQIADWLVQRANLTVKAELLDGSEISLSVSNQGSEEMAKAVVYLFPPASFRQVRVEGKVEHSYNSEERRLTLHFKNLKPGEVRRVSIRRTGAWLSKVGSR